MKVPSGPFNTLTMCANSATCAAIGVKFGINWTSVILFVIATVFWSVVSLLYYNLEKIR